MLTMDVCFTALDVSHPFIIDNEVYKGFQS